jgi:magnesium transporter
VAFCFYNLSSIVNGLVYFDQVSLLPTSHLLLVILGIFILLGGVWAVSLQAVNVDTWSGGGEADVPLIEDGATDEGSLSECTPTAPLVPQSPEHEHPRSHSESAALSPPHSPLSPRWRATHIQLVHSTFGGTNTVSSPPPSVHAPVFSIGLSPASPGFVLVPRERRRSISGQLGGDPWVEVIRRVRSRRIVSDTDALAGEEVERGIDPARSGENERIDSHRRWAWLRHLIVGQRGVS